MHDAAPELGPYLDEGIEYEWDLGRVTLPWGEVAEAAMAWPPGSVEAKLAGKAMTTEQLVRDVVCGMMIDPENAAATSDYQGSTYHFCAETCKAKFDSGPGQYAKPKGILARLLRW